MKEPTAVIRLHPESIEAIVAGVVLALEAGSAPPTTREQLVDAHEIARRLGRSPRWVRSHAQQLGGVRLGSGARPRHAFDPAVAMTKAAEITPDTTAAKATRPRTVRQAVRSGEARTANGCPLLPVRGVPA